MNIVGHRGASVACVENTPEAFATADRMGADAVELDVRIPPVHRARGDRGGTRLVIHHDALPEDVEAVDALPDLDDVLDACGDRMLINVEIKNSPSDGGHDPSMEVVHRTVDVLRRRGPRWSHRWLISSFNRATIDRCRRIGPDIPTAYLVESITQRAIQAALQGGHRAIHPWSGWLSQRAVDAAHAAGLIVNVWTVNDAAEIAQLADWGVDGLCTDVPDVALAALGREVNPTPTWRAGRSTSTG